MSAWSAQRYTRRALCWTRSMTRSTVRRRLRFTVSHCRARPLIAPRGSGVAGAQRRRPTSPGDRRACVGSQTTSSSAVQSSSMPGTPPAGALHPHECCLRLPSSHPRPRRRRRHWQRLRRPQLRRAHSTAAATSPRPTVRSACRSPARRRPATRCPRRPRLRARRGTRGRQRSNAPRSHLVSLEREWYGMSVEVERSTGYCTRI